MAECRYRSVRQFLNESWPPGGLARLARQDWFAATSSEVILFGYHVQHYRGCNTIQICGNTAFFLHVPHNDAVTLFFAPVVNSSRCVVGWCSTSSWSSGLSANSRSSSRHGCAWCSARHSSSTRCSSTGPTVDGRAGLVSSTRRGFISTSVVKQQSCTLCKFLRPSRDLLKSTRMPHTAHATRGRPVAAA